MTIPTAVDYAWFDQDDGRAVAENYCLSLVNEISPEELIHRLGGTASERVDGFQAVYDFAVEATVGTIVGVTRVGDWSLMVETFSGMGIDPARARSISRETVMVAHSRSVDMDCNFIYVSHGSIILKFDPSCPTDREGREPDRLLNVMEQVGFDITETESESTNGELAAFALAEYITGVRITPDVLDTSTYWIAIFPD